MSRIMTVRARRPAAVETESSQYRLPFYGRRGREDEAKIPDRPIVMVLRKNGDRSETTALGPGSPLRHLFAQPAKY
ncbi:hypothetical protein EVAR_78542_1 [Eumeta japonica]|uniref:Uncharacterized protein n=1 Tax=Eumeta variegata TaxID=151549 RepID=A0A4C1W8L0_EUMVA|nr:hypothetical protein EVAR_78542_1 [Eumeta japonica]